MLYLGRCFTLPIQRCGFLPASAHQFLHEHRRKLDGWGLLSVEQETFDKFEITPQVEEPSLFSRHSPLCTRTHTTQVKARMQVLRDEIMEERRRREEEERDREHREKVERANR